jgi:pectin methylesterase-like acyl-CoA thioesterase
VAQTGGGDFRSIAKALSAVPEGATIKVRPGLYRESLVLDKDVEIIGEGERAEIVLETTGAHCITMATDRAIVRNLTLRQRSQQSDEKGCVYIPQGTAAPRRLRPDFGFAQLHRDLQRRYSADHKALRYSR